jgi:hypothetical protein
MRRQDFVEVLNRLPMGIVQCDEHDVRSQQEAFRKVALAGRWTLEDLTRVPSELQECPELVSNTPLKAAVSGRLLMAPLWQINPVAEDWVIYVVPSPGAYPSVVVISRGRLFYSEPNVGPGQLTFLIRNLLQ